MANANVCYKAKRAANLVNPTSATTFLQADDSTKAAAVFFPVLAQSSAPKTMAFRFHAIGRALNSGSHNVTPKVSYGVSTTAGSNTIIAAGVAAAISTAEASWAIGGNLYWSSVSQVLTGHFWGLNGVSPVFTAIAILTAAPTAVDFSQSGLGLSVEITIATGGGDTGYLDELSLEVL